jgi:CheY-like chemotaxis protein
MTLPATVSKEDLKKYTLLIVDDEEILRDAMVFDFTRKGFTVLSADSGVTAFNLIQANHVDLVLSDMRMPGGDGLSLLEQIKMHDPGMPMVIFITGFAEVTEKDCIAKGAKTVLAKPFDRKVLMAAVMNTLNIKID